MSTLPQSLFDINSNKEQLIIGIVYAVVAISVFPIYIPIIYTIRVTKELNDNISYKLMNALNICDLLQCGNHILTGIFIIFPVLTQEIYPVVIFIGYTANTLWNSSFVIIAVLALTRLGVTFFHVKANQWTRWMKVTLFIGGLYMLVIWVMGCAVSSFELDTVNWAYNMTVPLNTFLSQQELYYTFSILVLSFSSYLLIIGNIYRKKRMTQSSTSLKTEIAILTQAVVLTTYMAAIMILWHNAEKWFDMTDITLSLLNGSWILFSHLNSFVLLVTNRTIRKKVLTLVGISAKNKKLSIVASTSSGNFAARRRSTLVVA